MLNNIGLILFSFSIIEISVRFYFFFLQNPIKLDLLNLLILRMFKIKLSIVSPCFKCDLLPF